VLSPLDAVLRGRNKLARTAAVDVLCSLPPRHPAVARALTSALEAIDDSALQARLRSRINDDSG
jgi:hypothetical protein